ncbi:cupin domain-containing protein [Paenibacillus sp. LHD-117]|uniref:cupin domain-containing protein n=1 Tax=Paenibacillus sp. LHD-117 TaxID=3071412 RepID=UPI0027DF71C6|nr:cupin domain-containing protein [Paenibacillus sp. LHD-117]MDQ6421531.1 cupin domain-containing protein [Paenibacillus sp. LHD-117]
MATSYMDYASPNTEFAYDLSNNVFFKKDDRNYILSLSVKQLNTLGNTSILDIFLSEGNYVEPHIHQNASELVYCVSGAAVVSLINPFTNQLLNFAIAPGQVANVPQGWWHYEVATKDHTHLLAIFDAPVPEAIFGSDILRLTPASVLTANYCLDEAKVKDTLAPIKSTVVIGPPAGCDTANGAMTNHGGFIQQGAHPQQGGWAGQGMHPHYGQPMMPQQGLQGQPGMMPQQPQQGLGTYAYPLRPIESAHSPYPPHFHPVPFLYRNWD